MAEAVALVCSVITLATALKDLIELGNKLKDFCEKVSKNDWALARLCVQLPSDLQELEKIYNSNPGAMDNSPALKAAVDKLVLEIKNIIAQFETLVEAQPKIGSKVFVKLKAAFKASDVENQIRDLKEEISNCYELFQRLAIVRIELTGQATQTTVEQTYLTAQNTQTTADKSYLAVQNTQATAEKTYRAIENTQTTAEQTHVAVQKLLAFSMEQRQEIRTMKSNVQQQLQVYDTSVAVSSTTTTIQKTSQSRTLACLEEHLNDVGVEVSKYTAAEYVNLPQRPVKPFVHHYPVLSHHISTKKRHRNLLHKVLSLLQGLEDDTTPIDDHALALNSLGDIFESIRMRNEATVVYTWAIDLYRILINNQPEHFSPFLAEVLCSRGSAGDIDDAIKSLEPMVHPYSSLDVHCQFAHQLVRRANSSERIGSRDDNLEDAKRALAILESILRQDDKFSKLFTLLDDDANLIDHLASLLVNRTQHDINAQTKLVGSGFITSDFELNGADSFLCTYSFALQCASQVDYNSGFVDAAHGFLLKAAIIKTHLASTYPDTNMEVDLAHYLRFFPHNISPPERKLHYLEESIKIYRKASAFDPKPYMDDLLVALSGKASWLQEQGRQQESHRTWCKMLELAPAALANPARADRSIEFKPESDNLLNCHVEEVVVHVQSVEVYHRTFNTYSLGQARACRALAIDYQSAGHNEQALRLAELATQQLQTLALKNPYRYTGELALTIVSWTNLLPLSTPRNNQFAIEKVKAILNQYDDLVRSNLRNFEHYNSLLSSLINRVDDPNMARSLSLDAVERLRRLAEEYPEAEDVGTMLFKRQRDHGLLLARCDLLDEAATWLRSLRDRYCHLAYSDEKAGRWCIDLLLSLGIVLKEQGDLKEAGEVLRTVVETGEQLTNPDDNTAWWCSLALEYQADIAGFQGEDTLALALSAECLSFAKSKSLTHIDHDLAFLPSHSRQLTISEQYEDSLSAAEELAARVRAEILDPSQYDSYDFIWPSEHLRTWATCLADIHKISEALDIAKQAVEEARRAKGAAIAVLRKMAESFYGIALCTLGCIQLFSDDRDGALGTLEETKELWKQRSKVRKFDLRNLVLAWWALGKLYCLLGRYEDAVAANRKLRKILKGLESSHPTMHLVVSVAIDQERRRPSWVKFLSSVAEELEHGHLEEVVPIMKKT